MLLLDKFKADCLLPILRTENLSRPKKLYVCPINDISVWFDVFFFSDSSLFELLECEFECLSDKSVFYLLSFESENLDLISFFIEVPSSIFLKEDYENKLNKTSSFPLFQRVDIRFADGFLFNPINPDFL
jgi:hypothetical protein